MRGRDAIAVALRHPDGKIARTERLDTGFHGTRMAKLPFVVALSSSTRRSIVGTRWLVRSAGSRRRTTASELGKGVVAMMLGVTFGAVIGIFFLVPLFVGERDDRNGEGELVQHLIEGLVRVAMFLGYLVLISRAPDIRRVFQYHGAEHMTIHALEPATADVDEVRKYPTAHQRCGTEFLVIVIMLSIFAFSLVGRQEPLVMIVSRVLLIPVIAAVGYEILRFGARHRGNRAQIPLYPGFWSR